MAATGGEVVEHLEELIIQRKAEGLGLSTSHAVKKKRIALGIKRYSEFREEKIDIPIRPEDRTGRGGINLLIGRIARQSLVKGTPAQTVTRQFPDRTYKQVCVLLR